MAVNRREFVQLGVAGAAGMLGAACHWPWDRKTSSLQINIKGLVIVERLAKSVTVNVVDASLIGGLMPHHPFLVVPSTLIDTAATSAPSQPDASSTGMRLFDLANKTVTLDIGHAGPPDLEVNDDSIGPTLPPDDAHWQSIRYSAQLQTLCGATKITDRTKFFSTLAIDHGLLHATTPDSALGRSTIWTFSRKMTSGPDQEVAKQAMTNTLVCDVPISGSSAAFLIGGQRLALNLQTPGAVTLRNLPVGTMPGTCKSGINPCVDDIDVFFDLVDAKFRPSASGFQSRNVLVASAEPNYCPSGSI